MKKIMSRAWEIARVAVNKFGGKVKMYFAVALKMAWAKSKNAVAKVIKFSDIEEIAADRYLEANYWVNYGKERIYIQNGKKSFGYIELNNGIIVDFFVKNQVNDYQKFLGYAVAM